MRTTLKISLAVLVALTMVSATVLAGGGSRTGTAGADQLLIPVGARGVALGSSFLAGITGIQAVTYNPAGLSGSTNGAEALFSTNTVIGDLSQSYVGVGANFTGFGHLAFTVRSVSFGDILITDERNPDGTGATFTPAFVVVGLTYSRALTDRIRAGITASLVSETIDRVSASAVSFDVGIQYQGLAGMKGLGLGVALKNIGSNVKYAGSGLIRNAKEVSSKRDAQLLNIEAAGVQLPTSLELGLAYKYDINEENALLFAGAFQNNNYLNDLYRLGLEYSFMNTFFVRGSYTLAGEDENDAFGDASYIYGPALGAGVNYDAGGIRLVVDYAYRMSQVFDGTHTVTFMVGF